jgi:ferrous iron transport protein B
LKHQACRVEAAQALLDPGGYHERRLVKGCGPALAAELADRRARIQAAGESMIEVEARVRYAWIEGAVERVVQQAEPGRPSPLDAADHLLTHRVWGLLILLVMAAGCFQAVYSGAGPLMNAIDSGLSALGNLLGAAMPAGAMRSLLVNGVVAGVGAVLIFLPQILILFLFIAILEDCGYMARAAFLLDRWMGVLGLNGKSFIPLLSSFACAVPGIMATRTIENRRDRFVTMLIAPLMSCSARLPVYVLLIGAFVPAKPLLGRLVSLQGVTLLGLYLVGITAAIGVTLILKHTVLRGEAQPFLMELPTYKWPSPSTVLYRVYEQGKAFCASAGTIIVAVTIVVWALGYYPHPASIAADHEAQRVAARQVYTEQLEATAEDYDPSLTADSVVTHGPVATVLATIDRLEQQFAETVAQIGCEKDSSEWLAQRRLVDETIGAAVAGGGRAGEVALTVSMARQGLDQQISQIDRGESGTYLRQSILGRAGRWIEPIVKPLGWDWRIGTAVIASFPAREVVVATMGTIYNLGSEQNGASARLRDRLDGATWPDGRPVFNLAVALSITVFFALCCQCAATLAVIKRETRSWRWPLLTFTYMTTLAYFGAMATYQIAIRLI